MLNDKEARCANATLTWKQANEDLQYALKLAKETKDGTFCPNITKEKVYND